MLTVRELLGELAAGARQGDSPFNHFCQICSGRGAPRAPLPLHIMARAPHLCSRCRKAEGAAFSIPHLARRKTLQPRCDQLHRRRMREAEEPESSHKATQVLQGWWDQPAEREDGTLSTLREWRPPGWHSFRQGHFSDHTGTLRCC